MSVHVLSDEAYSELCRKSSQYDDLKNVVGVIKSDIKSSIDRLQFDDWHNEFYNGKCEGMKYTLQTIDKRLIDAGFDTVL